MQAEVEAPSLKSIGKGTMIYLVGTMVSMLFGFVSRTIIARYGAEAQYGIYSLSLAIINIGVLLSCLGLIEGTTRYVAYFRGKGEGDKAVLSGAISINTVIITGLAFCLILFFLSEVIALKVFHDPALAFPLKIMSFCIPLISNLNIIISIFRGFGSTREKVYFQDISINVLFCIILSLVLFLRVDFDWVYYAYLIAVIITTITLIIYTGKTIPSVFSLKFKIDPLFKELLLFSLSLLVVSMLQMVLNYSDTFLLGYFKDAGIVGLYNAAFPVSQLILIPFSALNFNYAPKIAELYAQNMTKELGQYYVTITRWMCFTSFPMVLFIICFPAHILTAIWGSNYASADLALQILAVGVFFANLLGPNGTTLMIIGKTRFLAWASLSTVILNIILDVVLIPPFGIVGASIGTTIAMIVHCVIRHIKLHSYIKASPLDKRLLLSAAAALVVLVGLSLLLKHNFDIQLWAIPLLFFLFYGIYLAILILTKSFGKDDMMMLDEIGKYVPLISKILRKFSKRPD